MIVKVKSITNMNNKIGVRRYKSNANKVCIIRVGSKAVGFVTKRRERNMKLKTRNIVDKFSKYGEWGDTLRRSNMAVQNSGLTNEELDKLEQEARDEYAKRSGRY